MKRKIEDLDLLNDIKGFLVEPKAVWENVISSGKGELIHHIVDRLDEKPLENSIIYSCNLNFMQAFDQLIFKTLGLRGATKFIIKHMLLANDTYLRSLKYHWFIIFVHHIGHWINLQALIVFFSFKNFRKIKNDRIWTKKSF